MDGRQIQIQVIGDELQSGEELWIETIASEMGSEGVMNNKESSC
jgi:hypothetical protein